MSIHADTVSDDCTCLWKNHGPGGGYYLSTLNLTCPVHGNPPDPGSQPPES